MELLLVAAIGAVNILCFIVGARVGQKAVRGEEINVPCIRPQNPLEAHREREAKREAKREADRREAILENIERYDGTSAGQADIPGR